MSHVGTLAVCSHSNSASVACSSYSDRSMRVAEGIVRGWRDAAREPTTQPTSSFVCPEWHNAYYEKPQATIRRAYAAAQGRDTKLRTVLPAVGGAVSHAVQRCVRSPFLVAVVALALHKGHPAHLHDHTRCLRGPCSPSSVVLRQEALQQEANLKQRNVRSVLCVFRPRRCRRGQRCLPGRLLQATTHGALLGRSHVMSTSEILGYSYTGWTTMHRKAHASKRDAHQ